MLKNDYSFTQLWVMDYDTDLLKTEFNKDKIKASAEESSIAVTVANTRKQQEALAEWQEALPKATTCGKKFYVIKGEHVTSDDIKLEVGDRGDGQGQKGTYEISCKA